MVSSLAPIFERVLLRHVSLHLVPRTVTQAYKLFPQAAVILMIEATAKLMASFILQKDAAKRSGYFVCAAINHGYSALE